MKFIVTGTRLFYNQLAELDRKAKRIVEEKIELLERNPYRFKALHGFNIRLFRIRLNLHNLETRLVYAVIKPEVILLCFIARNKDYRELQKLIKELQRQLAEG